MSRIRADLVTSEQKKILYVTILVKWKASLIIKILNFFSGPNLHDDDGDDDDDDSTNTPAPSNNIGGPHRKPKSAQQVNKLQIKQLK